MHRQRHASRRRRPSYLVQQDEKRKLAQELSVLQSLIADIQARPKSAWTQILDVMSTNNNLRDLIHTQQLVVAKAQSLLAGMQESHIGSPLCRHVYMPKEWSERRQALLSLKGDMIARGCQYVMARSQHLDLMKPQLMDHRYEDTDGNFCCDRFEFFHFTGVQSLKQVFDAIKYFMLNMEITISEALGHTTVREDYDTMDDSTSIWNYRLVSTDTYGVTSEVNKVVLTEYLEESALMGGRPCAVMVTDSVDVDDLYPYESQKRVRVDISATTVLTQMTCTSPKSTENEQEIRNGVDKDAPRAGSRDDVVVVMQRAAFMKMHRPAFEIPRNAMRSLKEGIASWGEVEVQSIREAVNG